MDKLALEALLFSADFGEDHYMLASSSSSESDLDCCCSDNSDNIVEKPGPKRQKVEGFAEISVPLFDDTDFKNNFRISKATCSKVTELIRKEFHSDHKGGWERITPLKATYVLLWYLGNQETFKQISDRFRITQSCVHNIVRIGCRSLSARASELVKWPEEEQYDEESDVFHANCKISGILGAIAASHIKILKPNEDHEKYYNRNNYYSIAVQGIVGSKRNFTDIYICEGSLDSYEILNNSPISSTDTDIMGDYFLVGTNAYATDRWLVTPFPQDENLTPQQKEFNRYLNRACRFAQDAFGKLKQRFQRLNHFENRDIPFIMKCIEAACVLHNVCLNSEDDCEFFDSDEGVFEYVFDFDGENAEKRTEAFNFFVEGYGNEAT